MSPAAGETTVWDVLAGLGGLAAVLGVVAAIWIASTTLKDRAKLEGTDTCNLYRSQVISMHDRGMKSTRIRAVLELEDGNDRDPVSGRIVIETNCGSIDEITKHVPRRGGARNPR